MEGATRKKGSYLDSQSMSGRFALRAVFLK
jgi:hypothetical protein